MMTQAGVIHLVVCIPTYKLGQLTDDQYFIPKGKKRPFFLHILVGFWRSGSMGVLLSLALLDFSSSILKS